MKIITLKPLLAVALLMASACSTSGPEWADDSLPVHRNYEAPSQVQRISWSPVAGYDGAAHDFLVRGGDTLVVLDTRAAEVVTLVRQQQEGGAPERWLLLSRFGRIGDGPGEFRRVTALAAAVDGSIWTWSESARLQRFSPAGSLMQEERVTLPCPFFRSSMASLNDALYVAGQCASGGAPKDTVYARVYQLWPDTSGIEVAAAPVATMDFSFGSLFAAQRFVTEGRKSVVFMSGIDSCITRIPASPDAAAGKPGQSCTPPPALFSSEEPEFLRELRMPGGARPRWPDPITPLFAQVDAEPRIIVQVVSEDSLALTSWVPDAQPFLLAPANSFVGCRVQHCLWFDAAGQRLALLGPSEFARYSGSSTNATAQPDAYQPTASAHPAPRREAAVAETATP